MSHIQFSDPCINKLDNLHQRMTLLFSGIKCGTILLILSLVHTYTNRGNMQQHKMYHTGHTAYWLPHILYSLQNVNVQLKAGIQLNNNAELVNLQSGP